MIIGLAIVGTLAAIGIPVYSNQIEKTRIARAIAEIRMLGRVMMAYETDTETLPDSLNDVGYTNLLDSWGNPYQYLKIPGASVGPPEAYSEPGGPPSETPGAPTETPTPPTETPGPPSETPVPSVEIPDAGIMGKVRKDRFLVPLNSDYDLYSMGKDGQSKAPLTAPVSKDDIVRCNDGGYVGLASEF